MKKFINVTLPKFGLFALFVKNPVSLVAIMPAVAVVPVIDIKSASVVLAWMFVADLLSGILASYFDWKKSAPKDKWFFGKGEGFSSDKFKKCFVKAIVYAGAPLMIHKFQVAFMIKNFRYESVSDAEIGISTLLVLVFCLNEGYSIFHENLPKCGINIFDLVKNILNLKKEIQNEAN